MPHNEHTGKRCLKFANDNEKNQGGFIFKPVKPALAQVRTVATKLIIITHIFFTFSLGAARRF